jgi:cephalosporin hydroxylase
LSELAERRFPSARAALYGAFERTATAWFHRFYYAAMDRTWENTRWLGHRIQKFPGDVWVYQDIDIDAKPDLPEHERITYIAGSSTDAAIVERVRGMAAGSQTVLVILDSDHSYEHVAAELRAYADLVTLGSYLIVEDTNIAGHPVLRGLDSGPYEAVEHFLSGDARFELDLAREKFMMTFNPRGYLRRVR